MKYLFILIILIFIPGCDNEKPTDTGTNSNSTTPGDKLLPAEKGPVRSAFGTPLIDLASFRLTITGLVDSSISLNWQDIRNLESVTTDTFNMYCVEGWEVRGQWKGVLVSDLLTMAGVSSGGEHVLFHCADGYTTSLPIAYLVKYNSILAYQVNGKNLEDYDGFPLRLINYGKFGYKWAKWVNQIEITGSSNAGYWEKYGYPDRADVPLVRRMFYEGDDAQALVY